MKNLTYVALILCFLTMGFQAFSNVGQTTLNGAITSSTSPITVLSTASFPPLTSPATTFVIKIDNEYIVVSTATGTTFTPVTRGAEGSAAASHTSGATVTEVFTAGIANNLEQVGPGSPVAGNPMAFSGTGASNALSPVPQVFHITSTGTDQIFGILTAKGKCLTNATNPAPQACDIVVDPGVTDTETGPTLVGYQNCGAPCPPQQTLIIDNALVIFNGGHATGVNPGQFPQDDGLIIGPNGSLFCVGHGNGGVGITDNSSTHLNSVVTTLGGVALDPWQAGTPMARGEFVFDTGSSAVWRILSCTGSCTTGGSNPLASSPNAGTLWGTQVDNNITWQNIHAGGRFSLSSVQLDIEGCNMSTSDGAQVNNVFRVSGTAGAMVVIRNIAAIGTGTGTGSDDSTGSDAILIDPTQLNGFCIGSGNPLPCCSGPNGGTCQNSGSPTGSGLISWQGHWSQVNGLSTSSNPGYLTRITSLGDGGGVVNISIDGGQISDLATSATTNKLVANLSIDSGAGTISFNNMYVETGSGGGAHCNPPDAVVLNNSHDVHLTEFRIGGSGGSGGAGGCPVPSGGSAGNVKNALHILNSSTLNVIYQGSMGPNTASANAILNDITGYSLAIANGSSTVYNYGPSTANYIFDGVMPTFNSGLEFTPEPIASCGTCNAGAQGQLCYYNNDTTACAFSAVVAATGAHTGLAVCNGANWVMATCN